MNHDHNPTADTPPSQDRRRLSLRTHAADRINHLPKCGCPQPILQPWTRVTIAEATAIARCADATAAALHPRTRCGRAARDSMQALSRRAHTAALFSSAWFSVEATLGWIPPPPPARHELWEQTALHCYLCLCPVDSPNPPAAHIDHITPLSRGGTHCLTNLAIVHAECNLGKGARDWWDLPPGFHPHRTESERIASQMLVHLEKPINRETVYALIEKMYLIQGETLRDALEHAGRLARRR